MGIKSLNTILKNYAPGAIKKIPYHNLKGKIIAIDTSIYLYRFKYSTNNIINGFSNQIIKFLKNGIIPFYILDGIPPEEKQDVLNGRKNKKINLNDKCNMLAKLSNDNFDIDEYIKKNDNINNKDSIKKFYHNIKCTNLTDDKIENEIKKIKKQIITIKKDDITCLIELFNLFNIPYFECDGEAETFCAVITKEGLVDGCLTEDTDYIATGGYYLYKDFSISKKELIQINFRKILEELEFTYDQFLDMCILCGCDYTTKIKGIGPVSAMKLIKKYKNIESVLEYIKTKKKHKIPENFNYIKARKLFKDPTFVYNINELKSKCKIIVPNKEKIIEYIGEKITKSLKKEINKIDKYIPRTKENNKSHKKNKNGLIDSYFKKLNIKDGPIEENIS